jgi:hypothetical protein
MKMLLLPKAPLDLHVAANISENWRILNKFSQADFKFSHEPSLATKPKTQLLPFCLVFVCFIFAGGTEEIEGDNIHLLTIYSCIDQCRNLGYR